MAHVAPTTHVDEVIIVVPQLAPSVERMHVPDSGMSIVAHAPPMQCETVLTRDCVPVCVHGSLPKSHGVHVPSTGAAHIVPSVLIRVHACITVVIVGAHIPAWHVYEVVVRVCIPAVEQRSAASQLPNTGGVGAGQSELITHPTHAFVATSQCAAPVQGLTPSCTEHVPPAHVSPPLQSMPSSQRPVAGTCVHVPIAHASVVHALPSSQLVAQPIGASGSEPTSWPPPSRAPASSALPPPTTFRASEHPEPATRTRVPRTRAHVRQAIWLVCDGSTSSVHETGVRGADPTQLCRPGLPGHSGRGQARRVTSSKAA